MILRVKRHILCKWTIYTCLCSSTVLLAFVHLWDVVQEGKVSVVFAFTQQALESFLVGVECCQVLLKDGQGWVEQAANWTPQGHTATEVQAGGKQVLVQGYLVWEAQTCNSHRFINTLRQMKPSTLFFVSLFVVVFYWKFSFSKRQICIKSIPFKVLVF